MFGSAGIRTPRQGFVSMDLGGEAIREWGRILIKDVSRL